MKLFALLLTLLAARAMAATEDRVGRFFELDQAPEGKPIFVQRIHRETDGKGHRVSDSTIEDADGKIVMTEHAVLEGDHILSQRIDQLQIDESYELEVTGGNVHFRTFRLKAGKRELASEKTQESSPEFITGPATEPFLAEKLGAGGKAASAEFGIFELEKSVGFEFEKRGELDKGRVAKVRMQPQSFWLNLLVAPIDMEFDAKTYTLLRYKGRTPVRRRIHGSWKPLDALIIYGSK